MSSRANSKSVISITEMTERLRKDTAIRQLYVEIRNHSNLVRKSRVKDGLENMACGDNEDAVDFGSVGSDDDGSGAGESVDSRAGGGEKRKYCWSVRGGRKKKSTGKGQKRRKGLVYSKEGGVNGGLLVGINRGVEEGSVDPKFYCCGAKSTSKPTLCVCRYVAFRKHTFVQLLVVLSQLRLLRRVLMTSEVGDFRVQECFNSIFGVSNISTYGRLGGRSGTRGFFYYFHCMKSLGSFCAHSMHVLLTVEGWQRLSMAVICDNLRLRSVGDVGRVKAEFEEKASKDEWVVGRSTHESYSQIDILIGYSVYIRDLENLNKEPFRTDLVRCVVSSGLYQQPLPPTTDSGRKKGASKGMKIFLEQYDASLKVRPENAVRPYFLVANPVLDFVVKTCNVSCAGVHRLLKDCYHAVDVSAVSLDEPDALETVVSLSRMFSMMFGPDGSQSTGGCALGEVDGCKGLFSWCSGGLSGGKLKDKFPKVDLESLSTLVVEHVQSRSLVGNSLTGCYMSVSFKVNRLQKDGRFMQLPHLVLDPKVLAQIDPSECVIIRGILPLDNAGVVLRLWPTGCPRGQGFSVTERLVYVPPRVMLLLPATVPTSSCIRFSPQGQRRVEFVFALVAEQAGRCTLPPQAKFEDKYFYLAAKGKKKCKSEPEIRYCVEAGDEDLVDDAIRKFLAVFKF